MDSLFHFRSDDMPYAVHIQHVAQVTWLPALSPFDGGPVWLTGVLNLQGRNVPVIDFARFMGHAARPYATTQKLLVLQDTTRCVALIVDHVDGLQEPAQPHLSEAAPQGATPDLVANATANVTAQTTEETTEEKATKAKADVTADDAAGANERSAPEGSNLVPWPSPQTPKPALAIGLSGVLLGQVRQGDGWVMLVNAEKLLEVPHHWPAQGVRSALPGTSDNPSVARVFKARMHQLAQTLEHKDAPDAKASLDAADTPGALDAPGTQGPTPMAIVSTSAGSYAVALADITEFTRLRHFSLLPGCAPCIVGCMNLRGEVLTIVDIGSLVGGEPAPNKAQVMVLRHQGHPFACLIDRIDRLVSANASQVVAMHENDALHPLARTLLRDGDAVTPILNVDGLMALCRGQQALYNPH